MIYLQLLWTFLIIGTFTFGGGYAMIPLIKSEVIEKGWMSLTQLTDFIAISESTPGPFSVNISTFIGTEKGGLFGAVCATLGALLPSFVILLIIARAYTKFKQNKYINAGMSGLKPAVIGLIASAIYSIGKPVFFPDGFVLGSILSIDMLFTVIIFIALIILSIKKINPILLICISAVMGIGFGYLGKLI